MADKGFDLTSAFSLQPSLLIHGSAHFILSGRVRR
jgi:hypothetical protein